MLPKGESSWTIFKCECEYHIANGAPASAVPVQGCKIHRGAHKTSGRQFFCPM